MRSRPATILLSLLLALLPAAAAAGNIYKYQDENGIWHFTDVPPDDEKIDFDVVYAEKEREPRIKLRREGLDRSPVYLLFNDFWGPVEVELSFEEAVNVLSEPSLPARFVVPGQTEEMLLGVGALDEQLGFSYRLNMASVPGAPLATPVEGMVILPPLAAGEAYPISQGFNGETTHVTPDSTYAVDIVMPIGTAVHAARGGIVMDIEEDFISGGTDFDRYADKANHVRILHDDGTMAVYAHLDLASVEVRRGGRILAGQKIARSGNTGFSSGPHLHFAIQQNTGMKLVSVPFQFRTPDGGTVTPQSQQMLRGVAPAY
jgi:murein DD-endopeptidase MepM/ murein hydrolase activator NlpD